MKRWVCCRPFHPVNVLGWRRIYNIALFVSTSKWWHSCAQGRVLFWKCSRMVGMWWRHSAIRVDQRTQWVFWLLPSASLSLSLSHFTKLLFTPSNKHRPDLTWCCPTALYPTSHSLPAQLVLVVSIPAPALSVCRFLFQAFPCLLGIGTNCHQLKPFPTLL